jgi:hypothetical protein
VARAANKDLAQRLESINGRGLNDEEQYEIDQWQKGRELAHVVNSPGWDVVLEILGSYATKEAERLLRVDPANREEVLAAHAVAFAAKRIYTIFVEDAQNLIAASSSVPDVVKEGLRHTSPVPPESL